MIEHNLPKTHYYDACNDIYYHYVTKMIPPCEYDTYVIARQKYLNNIQLNEDEEIAIVFTSSYYAAVIRSTYKLFVKKLNYQPFEFWNATIKFAIFHSIWDQRFVEFFSQPEIKKMVKKTLNPGWTPIGLCGCNWPALRKKLEKWCEEVAN